MTSFTSLSTLIVLVTIGALVSCDVPDSLLLHASGAQVMVTAINDLVDLLNETNNESRWKDVLETTNESKKLLYICEKMAAYDLFLAVKEVEAVDDLFTKLMNQSMDTMCRIWVSLAILIIYCVYIASMCWHHSNGRSILRLLELLIPSFKPLMILKSDHYVIFSCRMALKVTMA